MIIEAE